MPPASGNTKASQMFLLMLECTKKWPASLEMFRIVMKALVFEGFFLKKIHRSEALQVVQEEHDIISLHQVFSAVSSLW